MYKNNTTNGGNNGYRSNYSRGKAKNRGNAQYKRRNYKPRNNRVQTGFTPGVTGIPDRTFVKLRYAETIRLTQAIASFDNHIFTGSTPADPNVSGVGHQPKGYDQWSQFYNKNMVLGSSIECTFTPTRNDSQANIDCYLLPTRDSTTLPGWTSIQEDRYGKTTVVGPYVGMGIASISDYMSTKKIFGDLNGLEQSDYGASFGSSPANQWYWIVGAESRDGTALQHVDVSVIITYYMELYDRKDLAQS